jgi:hypothetical protein
MADKSTTPRNLYQRMLSVADEAGPIVKDVSVTGFGGGYKGTSHDAVVQAVRNACVKHGVMVLPSVVEFVETEVTFTKGGTAYKITVTMDTTFINADDGADRFTTRTVGIGVDSQDKGPGKAMSYAKKYALMMAFLMTTGDNDEERQDDQYTQKRAPAYGAQNGQRPAPSAADRMTTKQRGEIERLAGHHTITTAEGATIDKWLRVDHTPAAASKMIDTLRSWVKDRTAAAATEPEAEWAEASDELPFA